MNKNIDCIDALNSAIASVEIEGYKLYAVVQGIAGALITKAFMKRPFKNVDFNFYKMHLRNICI